MYLFVSLTHLFDKELYTVEHGLKDESIVQLVDWCHMFLTVVLGPSCMKYYSMCTLSNSTAISSTWSQLDHKLTCCSSSDLSDVPQSSDTRPVTLTHSGPKSSTQSRITADSPASGTEAEATVFDHNESRTSKRAFVHLYVGEGIK
jgi:hypothetical protein